MLLYRRAYEYAHATTKYAPARPGGGQYNGHAGHPLDIDQLQWTQMTPCVTVTQSLQSKFEFYN